jgi:hypothetical protein
MGNKDEEQRQKTLEGDVVEDEEEEPDLNDFGEEYTWWATKGGYRKDIVSSLLQKSVRRGDEERAAWAAWELARSGHASNLWKRLNIYIIEDLKAGHEVALLVERYETMAKERWKPDSWEGWLCAIHAALTCARAPSSREATYANYYFHRVAQDRVRAEEDGDEMVYEPVVDEEDFEPGGELDKAVVDKHTYPGSGRGRGWRHFRVHGIRTDNETELGRKLHRRAREYDRRGYGSPAVNYTDEEIEHALAPVDEDDPWQCDLDEAELSEFD